MLTRETSNRSRHRDVFPVHQVKCFLTGQKAAGGCENLTHIENRLNKQHHRFLRANCSWLLMNP